MTGPNRREHAFGWLQAHRGDTLIFVAFFLITVILVGVSSDSVGFTRDEGYYFKAGEQYFGWFRELGESMRVGDWRRPFTQQVIDKHLKYNFEHPVLLKNLFALSFGLLKEQFGIFQQNATAFRFPAWLFAGLSVSLIFALARTLLPRRAAVLAALMWLSMPRAFWHMHLACFDIGVVAAHTWLVLAYLRGRRSVRGAIWVGVAFGLAAAVKHNVLIAPAFFVLHWLLVEAKAVRPDGSGFRIPPIPLAFFSMAIIGPLVFVLHWPYLWPAPMQRIGQYLGFHLQHEHYPILWFHDLLTAPPFPISFPFVMSAITVPVPVLLAAFVGVGMAVVVVVRFFVHRFQRGRGELECTRTALGDVGVEPSAAPALLLLLNAAFPFLLIALPSSPIFGGTKHWLNAWPFLCVLGAWAIEEGLVRARAALTRFAPIPDRRFQHVFALIALAIVLPGFWLTSRTHPYGLSTYNAVVGFARGAANAGFQRTFWGYESREVLPRVNADTKARGKIHFGDTNYDDWRFYRRDGLLRDDIGFSQHVRGADVAAVQPQGEFKKQWMDVLNEWQVDGPAGVVHIEGVPLLTVTFAP